MGRVAGRFGRVEPRRTARAFVDGLLSGLERKNCWWLAQHARQGLGLVCPAVHDEAMRVSPETITALPTDQKTAS